MHTVLLFNQEAVRLVRPHLPGHLRHLPGRAAGASTRRRRKKIASWLLQRFAERGNGVFQEFNDNGRHPDLGLGALDYSSLRLAQRASSR